MELNKNLITNIAVGLIGGSTGALGAWFIAKRHFSEIATQEIQSVKATYRKLQQEKPPIGEAAKELLERELEDRAEREKTAEALQFAEQLGYVPGMATPPGEFIKEPAKDVNVEVNVNLVDANADEKAFQVSETEPFLLTLDDYHDPKWDSTHETGASLIWWAGDNTLSDEQNNLIEDVAGVVGVKNMTMFGPNGMSGDNDTLYVSNPTSKINYEVQKTDASYAIEVLGIHG